MNECTTFSLENNFQIFEFVITVLIKKKAYRHRQLLNPQFLKFNYLTANSTNFLNFSVELGLGFRVLGLGR